MTKSKTNHITSIGHNKLLKKATLCAMDYKQWKFIVGLVIA